MTTIAQDLGGVVLLPCPFCGYRMTDEEGGVYQKSGFIGAQTPVWEVCCGTTMCNASVTATSREFAITAWNTRAHYAEIAGALRDAERYRWLRMRLAAEELDNEDAARMALSMVGPIGFRPADSDYCGELDTAIDSAMQQGGGGGE